MLCIFEKCYIMCKVMKNDMGEITLKIEGIFVIWSEKTSVEQVKNEFEDLMNKYAI